MSETNPHDQIDVDDQVDATDVDDQVDATDVDDQVDATDVDDQVDATDVDDQVDATDVTQVDAGPEAAGPVANAGLGDHATGDIVIDSALQDLHSAEAEDLDAQIEAGRRVHQTLHARLSDLGGE